MWLGIPLLANFSLGAKIAEIDHFGATAAYSSILALP
jgi:hypothetical protein